MGMGCVVEAGMVVKMGMGEGSAGITLIAALVTLAI